MEFAGADAQFRAKTMAEAVVVHVFNGLVETSYNLDGDLEVTIFSPPVFFACIGDIQIAATVFGVLASADLDIRRLQTAYKLRQKTLSHFFMHQNFFHGVAGRRVLHLGIDSDFPGHIQIGRRVDINVADAAAMSKHGNPAVLKYKTHKLS